MEKPEAVSPPLQIGPDGRFRKMPQPVQLLPADQGIVRFLKGGRNTVFIHPGKHRVQNRQQQPQHGGILRGQFSGQVAVFVGVQQGIRQRNFLHGVILPAHPHPAFLQQIILNLLHSLPPSGRSDRFHGRIAAPARQAVRSGGHPAVRSVLPAGTLPGSGLPVRRWSVPPTTVC